MSDPAHAALSVLVGLAVYLIGKTLGVSKPLAEPEQGKAAKTENNVIS